ncbi:hypothetical protein [Pantoea sp. App145]|uniref:hypothetical protein n=1 Tax=Pantoea sp. App145 TaxID=3071567 RepID=UPI003A7FF9B1
MTDTTDLALQLSSNDEGLGASLIGLYRTGTVQDAITWVTPFMFNGVGDGTTDDTTAIRSAITLAATYNLGLDLRGGVWLITGTLDFTNLRFLIADADSKILVNPTNFTSLFTAKYAVVFGDPDVAYNVNRCSAISMIGMLNISSVNRDTELNGAFIKASLAKFDVFRVSGFNGEGIKFSATWDTVVASVSCELCGNTSSYQFSIVSGGDTSNCLNIGRIQSEQAYHKCLYIACIRSFFGPIHAERTAITTSSDGTSGILSGLNYINFYINVGNTTFSQIIHDCITSGTAPDGTELAAIIPSVVFNLDLSKISACALSTSYVTSSFGRYSEYGTVRCVNWYFDSSNYHNCVVLAPYVSGVLYPSYKTKFIGGVISNIIPAFNASELDFDNCEITGMSFANTILGNIRFTKCIFPSTFTLSSTQTPSGYSIQDTTAETMSPVTFNDCDLKGTVTGAYQSRAIFNGGHIATVNAASSAALEFYGVKIGTFNHADTNNRGYITRQCKCALVTAWGYPNVIYWSKGMITERLGDDSGSVGQLFYCSSNTAFTWTKIA